MPATRVLHEHKHASIHQVISRGLDPVTHLKQSVIEWLGDVHEH